MVDRYDLPALDHTANGNNSQLIIYPEDPAGEIAQESAD
jgi:hypothetical protein